MCIISLLINNQYQKITLTENETFLENLYRTQDEVSFITIIISIPRPTCNLLSLNEVP